MYKLSNLAVDDIEKIYEYTLLNFGTKQADTYMNGFDNILSNIFINPLMGYECPDISHNLRRQDYGKHAIFYRSTDEFIFVIRILHQKMEPTRHFITP